jgi:hypothetical protein
MAGEATAPVAAASPAPFRKLLLFRVVVMIGVSLPQCGDFLQSVRTSEDSTDTVRIASSGSSVATASRPASSNGLMMHKVGAVAMKLALDAWARETGRRRDLVSTGEQTSGAVT